jgi:hypothetical protein
LWFGAFISRFHSGRGPAPSVVTRIRIIRTRAAGWNTTGSRQTDGSEQGTTTRTLSVTTRKQTSSSSGKPRPTGQCAIATSPPSSVRRTRTGSTCTRRRRIGWITPWRSRR